METHPVTAYSYRRIPILVLSLLLVIVHTALLRYYAGADWIPALIDGGATIGWFVALSYLTWFIVGTVSMYKTNLIISITVLLLWLTGNYVVCDITMKIVGIPYVPFIRTVPFRLLFGIPTWIAVLLWYHLQPTAYASPEDTDFSTPRQKESPAEALPQEKTIDHITVKDGSRIHIIKIEELLYVQACGDYATLVTHHGEYIKEQTMKYLEAHLPADKFVRIHRSSIVNITQISRLELFGKETYQLILKNGTKLRVSLTGYRLLKDRLGI